MPNTEVATFTFEFSSSFAATLTYPPWIRGNEALRQDLWLSVFQKYVAQLNFVY